MLISDNGLVRRIEAAPYQCEIAGIVVEKSLIRKASVIRIRLIEDSREPAVKAFNGNHMLSQRG